ncbi:MAG: hypothetical protein INR71_06395 [Terriglobus roseus]|nr:hypothetical protein [Terriglobus roseus]
MQKEISRQIEMLRSLDDPQESLPPPRGPLFGGLSGEPGAPLSPRQTPHDESRRGSLAGNSRLTPYRGLGPSHLSASPRRYGSISGSSSYSPSAARPPAQTQLPPPPAAQYSLAPASSPPASLARRHTSADIRVGGWGGHQQGHTTPQPPSQSSYAPPGHASGPWPSSPHRTPLGGDQEIRNTLAQYELGGNSGSIAARGSGSRRTTPPQDPGTSSGISLAPISGASAASEAGWQLPGAKYPFRSYDASGPPTRRSSMASNVHSLLNPAETAERPGEAEDEGPGSAGGGKRKRMQ